MNLQELFTNAIELYKSGKLNEASNCCEQLVQLQPAFSDAYNLSGLIARDQKDFILAVKQFRRALQINEKNTVYLNNLGQALLLSGKEEEAIKTFKKVLKIDAHFIPSLLHLGKVHRNNNDLEEATRCFETVLNINPNHLSALNNLGNVFQLEKKQSKALELYHKALQLSPNTPELHFNLGNIFLTNGQLQEAEEKFTTTLNLNPNFFKAHVSFAQLYFQLNQHKKAKKYLLQATKLNPDDSEVLFMLANMYRSNGQTEEAILFYKKSFLANPMHAMAANNLGMTYFSIGMTMEANDYFQKALNALPGLPEALLGMAKLKESEKQYPEACDYFEKVIATDCNFQTQAMFDYFLLKLRIVKWDLYDEDIVELKNRIASYLNDTAQNFQLSPLILNYFPVEQSIHKAVAEKYASIIVKQIAVVNEETNFTYPVYEKNKGEKIKIGYISPDFRTHAVGMLLNQLFAHHDKSKFEVYAYSIVNNDDEYNRMFKESAGTFRDITKLSFQDTATLINKDQIHVLIDLAGYTTYTRTQILALRPAPVQMQFMGYPDTMGAEFIDYIMADEYLIPEKDQQYYTEKVAYLNHAFFSSPFKESDKQITREALGLPADAFVYCCYNSYYKLSPDLLDVWAKLLKQTDNTVLWLTRDNDIGAENILKEFEGRGVGSERIIFAKRLPMDEYLSSYRCADLFLDTFNYSAGSTAVCSLWGEVPVLTYAGTNNASRMGASIVNAAGLHDFICNSKEEYLRKAIMYSKQKENINSAKAHLKQHKMELPLFHLKKAVGNIEEILMTIVK